MAPTVLCRGEADLDEAAGILRAGGLVAFPTETVYGLGADAANPAAVARIFQAKGRPADHPVIVHLPDTAVLPEWVRAVPEPARALAAAFWPGPLTLILERAARVPDAVTGGQDTVGLRVPAHPLALGLLERFGSGIAAPSANRFGRISPTCALHVIEALGDRIDAVIDGGPCPVGIESTIVDLSGNRPRVVRPGMITMAEIATVLNCDLEAMGRGGLRAPGALPSHYAPTTPLRLVARGDLERVAAGLHGEGRRIGVLAIGPGPAPLPAALPQRTLPASPKGVAHELYTALHELDAMALDLILAECPAAEDAWAGIADRLGKAAAASEGPGRR